jgi:hypothetical protein
MKFLIANLASAKAEYLGVLHSMPNATEISYRGNVGRRLPVGL